MFDRSYLELKTSNLSIVWFWCRQEYRKETLYQEQTMYIYIPSYNNLLQNLWSPTTLDMIFSPSFTLLKHFLRSYKKSLY